MDVRGNAIAAVVSSAMALTMAAGLSGCSGAGDGPSASGTGGASESPSESPSLTPTVELPESTPSAEPASGPRLAVGEIRVNAPARWKQDYDTVVVDGAVGREGSLLLSVASTSGEQLSLRQAERYFWNRNKQPENYEAQDGVVMGNINAGYYTYGDSSIDAHVVTTWDAGYVVKVELRFYPRIPQDRQREIVESVIASYESA
ncbi:hypothetical protein [Nocardioides flavus (ex Wang et al. 2016)]